MSQETYTQREVVELLVQNNNEVMKMLGENKTFVIEGNEVVCYRIGYFFPKKELSRNSFNYVINQVKES